MSQRLLVFQSLWAMERRHTDGRERSLEQNVRMIAGAGFDGLSAHYTDRTAVRRLAQLRADHGLDVEGQCFPRTVDDLQPVLENAVEFGAHHIDLQPDVRPRTVAECVALIDGWQRLAEQVDVPVYIETHRDRMTTDLYFTLDLLDTRPELRLLGDISHYPVGREFARRCPTKTTASCTGYSISRGRFTAASGVVNRYRSSFHLNRTGCGSTFFSTGGATASHRGVGGQGSTTRLPSPANWGPNLTRSSAATATT